MKINAPYPQLFFTLLAACFAAPLNSAAADEYPPDYPVIAKVTTYTSITPGGEESSRTKVKESLAFVVEKDGHLLTSYRTLLDLAGYNLLQTIEVELFEGPPPHRYDASIVGVEPTINIAILKINPDRDLRVSRIIGQEDIEAAQTIHAVAGFEEGRPVLISGRITRLNSMECYQESMTSTMFGGADQHPR